MTESDTDIQVINFKKELEIESESESEVFMEKEQIQEPYIIKVESEDPQFESEPVHNTQMTQEPIELPVIHGESKDFKVFRGADVQVKGIDNFSSHPSKKKAKIVKLEEDVQDPENTLQIARIKVEPVESMPGGCCEVRRSRRAARARPPSDEEDPGEQLEVRRSRRVAKPPVPPAEEFSVEQFEERLRRMKREPSTSPSLATPLEELPASTGELGAMRQLLATLQRPVDDDEVFGAHVASELRALRRPHLKRRLRRLVQEAILAVSREDDDDPSS